MIDKEAPILAFDVSKGSSHCQGYLSFGKPSSKPIKAAHSRSGMAAAEGISETLERKTGRKPKVVMESTGVYSKPVIRWAESLGLEVYLISPLESACTSQQKVDSKRMTSFIVVVHSFLSSASFSAFGVSALFRVLPGNFSRNCFGVR